MHTQQTGHSLIRKGYNLLCKIELIVAAILFLIIVSLVFIAAITRKLGAPIQWTMDVTQLLFAWLSFLSGDIALRNGVLPGLDMVVLKMPKKVQVVLKICFGSHAATVVFFVPFGLSLRSRTQTNIPTLVQLFVGYNQPAGLLDPDDSLITCDLLR